jgi:hypothetical protein
MKGTPDFVLIPLDTRGFAIGSQAKLARHVPGGYALVELKLVGDNFGQGMIWTHCSTVTQANFIQLLSENAIIVSKQINDVKSLIDSSDLSLPPGKLISDRFPGADTALFTNVKNPLKSSVDLAEKFNKNYSSQNIVVTKKLPELDYASAEDVTTSIFAAVERNSDVFLSERRLVSQQFEGNKVGKPAWYQSRYILPSSSGRLFGDTSALIKVLEKR